MTVEDIASFCEIKDCRVSCGSPETGAIQINGNGVIGKLNNYRRFLALNEMSSLPNPKAVILKATEFRIETDSGTTKLSREEFQAQLDHLQQLIG